MKNIFLLSFSLISLLSLSGCSTAQVKKEPTIYKTCNVGGLDSTEEHCLLTTESLMGVVETADCNEKKECRVVISDERGRKIKYVGKDLKVGERVNIFFYKKPEVTIKY